jgi:hypothetical protein
MAGFRLPTKSTETFIDLQPYGGEGKLAIRPPNVADSIAFRAFLTEKAKEDGITVKNDSDLEELAQGKYVIESMSHTIETCVFAVEEDGERPLTAQEGFSLPTELLQKIFEIISLNSKFPLAQNAGKGQK